MDVEPPMENIDIFQDSYTFKSSARINNVEKPHLGHASGPRQCVVPISQLAHRHRRVCDHTGAILFTMACAKMRRSRGKGREVVGDGRELRTRCVFTKRVDASSHQYVVVHLPNTPICIRTH